jgi:hypothetical protein
MIIKNLYKRSKVLKMSGISTNKSWIKESETLYYVLISFVYGLNHKATQFNISFKTLRKESFILRFFDKDFASLIYTLFKEYVRKKHFILKKHYNLVPFIRAFPVFTKT